MQSGLWQDQYGQSRSTGASRSALAFCAKETSRKFALDEGNAVVSGRTAATTIAGSCAAARVAVIDALDVELDL
jgi:hypothetical protein